MGGRSYDCFNHKGFPQSIKGIDEIEILIIDDGSTDNTLKEALKMEQLILFRIPIIKV